MALLIRSLGLVAYEPTWRAMQAFTAQRDAATPDEIWLLQHPPIFTLGQAGKPEHLLQHSDIPLLNIDRGGQITYHAPGQLVAYLLIDLKRRNLGVRELVSRMEQAVIGLLDSFDVQAQRRADAPGVYVRAAKIAALGLRIRRGCSYHGLALNVDMDLTPFGWINPCGYAGLAVTQTRDLGITASLGQLEQALSQRLREALG